MHKHAQACTSAHNLECTHQPTGPPSNPNPSPTSQATRQSNQPTDQLTKHPTNQPTSQLYAPVHPNTRSGRRQEEGRRARGSGGASLPGGLRHVSCSLGCHTRLCLGGCAALAAALRCRPRCLRCLSRMSRRLLSHAAVWDASHECRGGLSKMHQAPLELTLIPVQAAHSLLRPHGPCSGHAFPGQAWWALFRPGGATRIPPASVPCRRRRHGMPRGRTAGLFGLVLLRLLVGHPIGA
eukprot:366150-Chlamydomonas_euryale.AAC.4